MKWWQCIQRQEKGLNLILILMLLLPTHQRLSLQQRITRLIFRQLICPRRLIWRIVQRNTPILLQRTSQPTIRLTTRQPTFLPSRQHTTTENRANGEEEATLEANREKVQNLDHGDQTCGDQVTLQQPILRLRFLPPLTFRRIIRWVTTKQTPFRIMVFSVYQDVDERSSLNKIKDVIFTYALYLWIY